MRRVLLIAAACVTSAGAAYGQGQGVVIFQNYNGVNNAPVRCNGLYVGSEFKAELGYFVGTTTLQSDLTLLPSSITSFYGNFDGDVANGAGYFQGPAVNIPGVTSPALAAAVTFEVFVWSATSQASGHSPLFTMSIGGTGTPPNIPLPSDFGNNLQPFTVHAPEPSTLALAGMGAAGLLLFRRRK